MAERLVGEGFLSYDDLSVIEPDDLMEMGQLTREQVEQIVAQAEMKAEEAEQAAAAERRRLKEQERIEKATAEAEALERAREQHTAESGSGGVESDAAPDTLSASDNTSATTPERLREEPAPAEQPQTDSADAQVEPTQPAADDGPPDETTRTQES